MRAKVKCFLAKDDGLIVIPYRPELLVPRRVSFEYLNDKTRGSVLVAALLLDLHHDSLYFIRDGRFALQPPVAIQESLSKVQQCSWSIWESGRTQRESFAIRSNGGVEVRDCTVNLTVYKPRRSKVEQRGSATFMSGRKKVQRKCEEFNRFSQLRYPVVSVIAEESIVPFICGFCGPDARTVLASQLTKSQ